jgi:polyisoprenoid-binding protein YceI
LRPILAAAALALCLAVPAARAQAPSPTVSADPAAVRAGTFKLDPAHSKVTWAVNHFGFSTYMGQFHHLNGEMKLDPKDLAATALDVTVDAATVGTFDPALDNHLKSKDFLDVAQFPTATFHATKVTRTGDRSAEIAGDLTLHGVTHPVSVLATFNQGGRNPVDPTYRLGFAGAAKIRRSDFGVKAYLPVLGDDVTLTIEAEFKLQSPGGAVAPPPKY